MKNVLVVLFAGSILFSSTGFAVDCTTKALSTQAVHNFPGAGYWMQAAGDRYITYTEVGGMGSHLYDLNERKPVPITDDIDAFPLPEGDIYVHPDPLRFFKLSDAIAQGRNTQPVYSDRSHQGYYESVGTVSKTDSTHRTVRVLTAEGHGAIQDYLIETKSDGSIKVTPKFGGPIKLCNNLGRDNIDFQTPILSRDGTMMATKDFRSGHTKVFKLSTPGGECKEVADLGDTQNDKVSFSFDNKHLSYTTPAEVNGRDTKQLHEFSMDGQKSAIISGPNEEVRYHGYRPDGTLMYTRSQTAEQRPPNALSNPLPVEFRDQRGGMRVDYSNDEYMGRLRAWYNDYQNRDAWDAYSRYRRPSYQSPASDLVVVKSPVVGDQTNDQRAAAISIGKAWGKACDINLDDESAVGVGARLTASACAEAVALIAANAGADKAGEFCKQSSRSSGETPRAER